LESNCCLLWDTDTLEFVCCIQHDDEISVSECTAATERQGFSGLDAAGSVTASTGDRSDAEELTALEVQWMGHLIVTWMRNASNSLKVWTLDGELFAHLHTDNPLVQVDVARVTWVSVKTLDHFILAALDTKSVVSLYDSKDNFQLMFRFCCGCEEPFDLVLTQDFMAVINDNMADNCLEITFWRLWLHPNFEADPHPLSTAEAVGKTTEAACIRRAAAEPGGKPAGADFYHVARAGPGHHLHEELYQELRPNARPIKKLVVSDIDSYFASYRNFLNVCSFHKSGQESLSVYRSSSLQKKIFFPPAKHTKFEEWLALQVHNDGTVVLHDFRPNQIAFDELAVGDTQQLNADRKEVVPENIETTRRRNEPAQHRFGSRSRGH
jgi:hypothetical protein